jgi:protein kinase C substrate 80K-H
MKMKMTMKMTMSLLLLLLLCSPAAAFSLFRQKPASASLAPASPPRALLQEQASEAARSFFRGMAPHERDAFSGELFACKTRGAGDASAVIVIPRARVNDNYCDCEDGSDEPGTSACANGVFTCQNEGFKPLQLTSSRVDDGVCDCCDGSDEDGRLVLCENTCDAQAAASRKALEASLRAYEEGSKVREQYIRDITAQVTEGETAMSNLDANEARISDEILRLQGLLEEEGRIERAEQDAVKQRMLSEYAARLGLEALAVPDLASLIANLFTVFGKWGRTRTCTLCAFSTYTFG